MPATAKAQASHPYLVTALAVVGAGALVSSSLLGVLAWRLAERLDRLELERTETEARTRGQIANLSAEILRQQEEMNAIQRATDDELRAIQEANEKLARVRGSGRELAALRDANQALWTELAQQRAELLKALRERPAVGESIAPLKSETRFRLQETRLLEATSELDGAFEARMESSSVQRATQPTVPAYLVLEIAPESVSVGEPFELSVRVVNRSNAALEPRELRLAWSLDGRRTGGTVPLVVQEVAPRERANLCNVTGDWSPSHERGGLVEATLQLSSGDRIVSSLIW